MFETASINNVLKKQFRKIILMIFFLLSTLSKINAAQHHSLWKITGDVLECAIPAIGFGVTLNRRDYQGSREFIEGFLATGTTAFGLKSIIHERRPSGGKHSFPSGHAAFTFFGSGFIHQRYGWRYALPAYAAATIVGFSRYETNQHWVHDIVGGAAIGLLYSILLTSPYSSESDRFYPSFSPAGLSLHYEKSF